MGEQLGPDSRVERTRARPSEPCGVPPCSAQVTEPLSFIRSPKFPEFLSSILSPDSRGWYRPSVSGILIVIFSLCFKIFCSQRATGWILTAIALGVILAAKGIKDQEICRAKPLIDQARKLLVDDAATNGPWIMFLNAATKMPIIWCSGQSPSVVLVL